MSVLSIVGCCDDRELYFCKTLAQKLIGAYELNYNIVLTLRFESLLEIDYIKRFEEQKRSCNSMYTHRAAHYILLDGTYLGDVDTLQQKLIDDFGHEQSEENIIDNIHSVTNETARCLGKNDTVFLAFSCADPSERSGERPYDRKLTIQLFNDVCPIACENFLKLCTGENGTLKKSDTKLHYLNCPIHRIVSGGWLQCGDIVGGSGANSIAAIGDNNKIHDENLSVDFSEELGGIVGFATSSAHSNGSQFLITLGPCPWMNSKFIGIGRVVRGFQTLKQINKEETKNQKPVHRIFVTSCGKESHILSGSE